MFTKLKNEFAQAKFEGDSRKAKNRTEKTKKNGEKMTLRKRKYKKSVEREGKVERSRK